MPAIYGLDSTITLGNVLLADERTDGVVIVAETLEGWGSPASTMQVAQRPRSHGGIAGEGYLEPRPITINGFIKGPTWALVRDAAAELEAACSLSGTSLTVQEDGLARSLVVRRNGPVLTPRVAQNRVAFSLSLLAPDPRKTGAIVFDSTGLPMTTGGLTVPFTIPFTIDATTSSGRVALVNPGNIAGRVMVRIDAGTGGLEAPRITHTNSGRSVTFAAGLTIPEGSYVDIDMDSHTVLEQGTAPRGGWVIERGWSDFEPGDNEWHFTASSGDGTMTVTGWPSWQ